MAKTNKTDLVRKDVSLVGKDFGQLRKNLIEFSKNYFPNTFNDFNESSPGMMFIEMASYVGDVLSFYTDTQLRESLLINAEEKANLFNLAATYGYKPKNIVPSAVTLDVFQLVPSKGSGDTVRPDYDYGLKVARNMSVGSDEFQDVEFRTTTDIDFQSSSSFNPTEVSVYSINESTNEPIYYLLKKQVKATSGTVKTETFIFGSAKIYDKIRITDSNIIKIKSITDEDNDIWTEVPFLAQDTVFEQIENNQDNTLDYSQHAGETPYLLQLNRVPKRFITKFEDESNLTIQFGAGISSNADEEIIPNPDNVGSALYTANASLDQGIDPSNFLYTKTYGVAPSNTTLTVEYFVGNGIKDNVPAKDLINITGRIFENDNTLNLNQDTLRFSQNSLAVTNPTPAVGGRSKETDDEIRNNAMAYFAAQNRTVSREDYIMRCYALPPQFGSVAKAYILQDYQIENKKVDGSVVSTEIPNPLALNLYTLGYDNNKKLTQLNNATKTNLKTYISYYRMLTDAVNIKDAFIVNIAIQFDIIVLPDANSNETLLRCIAALKDYFNIDNWSINQPITLSQLYVLLDGIQGVQTVPRPDAQGVGGLQITNKYNGNYSPNKYSINTATKMGVIFPPKDSSIFEVKFPNLDIKGKVITQSF
jgi:phage-related baseplate assembly protein